MPVRIFERTWSTWRLNVGPTSRYSNAENLYRETRNAENLYPETRYAEDLHPETRNDGLLLKRLRKHVRSPESIA